MPALTQDPSAFRPFDRLIVAAERATGLLARCQPLNGQEERVRLLDCFARGRALRPQLQYAPIPDLRGVRADLEQAHHRLQRDPISCLYAERLEELLLEAEIVSHVGSRNLRRVARRRYCGEGGPAEQVCRRIAEDWAAMESAAETAQIRSDDADDPESLLSLLRAAIGARRLPFRVAVSPRLSAAAATGDGVVYVAASRLMTPAACRRVAVHELYGHVLPRQRASVQRLGLFHVGSAGGNDEQEGLALFYEANHHLLDGARKSELALRHLAALALFEGASFHETVTGLIARHGAQPDVAVSLGLRVYRGGGLGREVAYLPAYLRVVRRVEDDAGTLSWLSSGRLSLTAIDILKGDASDLAPVGNGLSLGGAEVACPLAATSGSFSDTMGR